MHSRIRSRDINMIANDIIQQARCDATPLARNQALQRVIKMFSIVLRSSPEHTVRDIIDLIEKSLSIEKDSFLLDIIKPGADQALKNFQQWGCQIARYYPEEMKDVEDRYVNHKISLDDEIKYGTDSYNDAVKALALCKATGVKNSSWQVAFEYLIDRHYQASVERGSDKETCEAMRTKRKDGEGVSTPVEAYSWATPLVQEMEILAQNETQPNLIPNSKCEEANQRGYHQGYALLYMGEPISYIVKENENGKVSYVWKHGRVSPEKYWPILEKLHRKVLDFDLDTTDEDSVEEFYDKVIEMIWLIGNVTPLHRGTGKLVEQWFTMAHLAHGLRTPILNLDNPQLDCLNISLPLNLYKERFFNFFEPDSFHKDIRKLKFAEHNMDSTVDKFAEIRMGEQKGSANR